MEFQVSPGSVFHGDQRIQRQNGGLPENSINSAMRHSHKIVGFIPSLYHHWQYWHVSQQKPKASSTVTSQPPAA